jgi:hypothetical protein
MVALLTALATGLSCLAAEAEDPVARLDAKLAELREQGYPITFQEVLDQREPLPDEENSAPLFLEAFELMKLVSEDGPLAAECGGSSGRELGVRSSDVVQEMNRVWLAENARALELIREGAGLPGGRYPIEPEENPFAILLSHLADARRAARLCSRNALSRAERGEGEAVALALCDALGLSRSLGENLFLIDALVRFAVDAIFTDALEQALSLCELPPERLAELRAGVAREAGSTSLRQAFITECAGAHYYFVEMPLGQLREAMSADLGARDKGWFGWLTYGRRARARDALKYYDIMGAAIDLCAKPPRQRLHQGRQWAGLAGRRLAEGEHSYPISAALMPALGRAMEEEVKALARLDVVRTALAVEQWRIERVRWPHSLDDLVPGLLDAVPEDPFGQETIRYARTDDGVVVYSLGPDGTDEGGLSQDAAQEAAGEGLDEGWDIAFRLLSPERRGARQLTLAEEAEALGTTPLHAAVLAGSTEALEAVLAAGADVDATDEDGQTALHAAAGTGRRDVVERLIAASADVNVVDFEHRTPAALAAEQGHHDVADLLHEHGGVE